VFTSTAGDHGAAPDGGRLDDEALVLERPRLGAHAHPVVAAQRVGAGGGEDQLGAGLDEAADQQRELDIVADRDPDPAERRGEHAQFGAAADAPPLALEAGHHDLVLVALPAFRRGEAGAVVVAAVAAARAWLPARR
jgi:hypothetical protein